MKYTKMKQKILCSFVRSWDHNSVCPSEICMLCDEMKERTADILIPHERVVNLAV